MDSIQKKAKKLPIRTQGPAPPSTMIENYQPFAFNEHHLRKTSPQMGIVTGWFQTE